MCILYNVQWSIIIFIGKRKTNTKEVKTIKVFPEKITDFLEIETVLKD